MDTKTILMYYLGLVFVAASLHRIWLFEDRQREKNVVLKLPPFSDILIIAFEFIVGVLLLTNSKYKYQALFFLFIFLIVGSILIAVYNMDTLKKTYTDAFTYQPTFMSFALHLAYIVMIGAILWDTFLKRK
jgi:uncharacterized membrane protein YphA (DoxX/SURF4 family)